MAKAEQILSLIKAHYSNEPERFTTSALQVAAHEAKLGHINIAEDIRKQIDNSKKNINILKPLSKDLEGLVLEVYPSMSLNDLVVSDSLKERIERIISEFVQSDKLRRHNLKNRRKVLFSGPPGTGKTMSASIIAQELNLPLYIILMDKMVTKFMGETSAKLRLIFDIIQSRKGVYLFDEFDAIGGNRGIENDVGEMRRVLNSFLQFIEMDDSDSLIVAATNNLGLLDQALFRRFDDVLQYRLPSDKDREYLFRNILGNYLGDIDLKNVVNSCNELSHSEITQACIDAIKCCVLNDIKKVDESMLLKMIEDRKSAYIK
ncbi:MAG: ATP-binding protein [Marinifilaceae bacterium]